MEAACESDVQHAGNENTCLNQPCKDKPWTENASSVNTDSSVDSKSNFSIENNSKALSSGNDLDQTSFCKDEQNKEDTSQTENSAIVSTGDNSNNNRCTQTTCEICDDQISKYTCPRCTMRTCSLVCVKAHKVRLDCSGERDKTAFVPTSEYSDLHLLNDYRFLEGAERTLYSNKTAPQNRQRHCQSGPYHLNKRCKLLISAAHKRGVRLSMVSSALSKNRLNTSFYTVKTDSIDWHIDWHFVVSNTILKDEKVSERTPLIDAVGKFTNFVQYPHLRKPLEDYKKDKLNQCTFLLKVEGLPANRIRYFVLHPKTSVADNLKGHCLTEYPSIYVLPCSFNDAGFQVLSKDDIVHMSREHTSHLLRHHEQLRIKTEMESQLLNPSSNLYTSTA